MFLSRCAGINSVGMWQRALTKKFTSATAACQELGLWCNLFLTQQRIRLRAHDFVTIIYMIPDLILFLGTSSFWWLCAEGRWSAAQPEICFCCRSLQQWRKTIGRHHRRDNVTDAGIHACPTASHMGSLGTGMLFTTAISKIAFNIKQKTNWDYLYFILQVAFQTEQYAIAKRACKKLWSHYTKPDCGSSSTKNRLAAIGWGWKTKLHQIGI